MCFHLAAAAAGVTVCRANTAVLLGVALGRLAAADPWAESAVGGSPALLHVLALRNRFGTRTDVCAVIKVTDLVQVIN